MLLLFENTLTHYIYIVFYTLISRARLAHNLGKFYAMSRHATPTATPSPQSEQLHPMSNHTRTESGRTTAATPPPRSGHLHAMSNHTRTASGYTTSTASWIPKDAPSSTSGMPHASEQCAHDASRTPPPGCASEYTYKFRLTLTTSKGCSSAVALSHSRFVQNHNSL